MSRDPTMPAHPRARARRGASEGGFTLIEVMIAAAVTVVGALGGTMAIVSSRNLQAQTREYGEAVHAARNVYEQLRNGDLFARMQELRAQPNFQVGTLDVTVTFPVALGQQLLGQAIPPGRFADLDQDGQVEVDPAAAEDASLLPVLVTVRWGQGSRLIAPFLVTAR